MSTVCAIRLQHVNVIRVNFKILLGHMRQRLLWVYESIEAMFLVILSNINAVWWLPCFDIFE